MRWLDGITDSMDSLPTQSTQESEQTPGAGDIQGGLTCCCPLGHKESDMTEQLNQTNLRELKRLQNNLCNLSKLNYLQIVVQ